MHFLPRRSVTLSVLVLLLCITSSIPAGELLQAPTMLTYDNDGVTTGTLRASFTEVTVGDTNYVSLVFNDKYDAPLIRTRPGGTIRLLVDNQMSEPTALHFHGLQVSPLDNGDNIFKLIQPGEQWEFVLKIPQDHPPGMYWYHSHFNKGSQRQVNGGIAGAIMVDGMLDPFPELAKLKQHYFVLRNFQKTITGKLASDMVTGAPSIRTVNGQLNPLVEMQPGETQIWHFANIASNQYFRIAMEGVKFRIISRDGNTATAEETVSELLLGPSARMSVLVDGPPAGTHALESLKVNTGPAGDVYPQQTLATIQSSGPAVTSVAVTSNFPIALDLRDVEIANRRSFVFQDSNYDPNLFLINGEQFDFNRVNTTVKLGDTEEWVLSNPSGELHQFHIHQTDFQVVEINGKPVPFTGYRDNVFIPTSGSITLRIPFTDPIILGKYVYHCHILEHEDGGMMAVIQVVKPEDYAKAVTLERVGGIYGNNETCAYLLNTGQELELDGVTP